MAYTAPAPGAAIVEEGKDSFLMRYTFDKDLMFGDTGVATFDMEMLCKACGVHDPAFLKVKYITSPNHFHLADSTQAYCSTLFHTELRRMYKHDKAVMKLHSYAFQFKQNEHEPTEDGTHVLIPEDDTDVLWAFITSLDHPPGTQPDYEKVTVKDKAYIKLSTDAYYNVQPTVQLGGIAFDAFFAIKPSTIDIHVKNNAKRRMNTVYMKFTRIE